MYGVSNWRLSVRREDSHIAILSAVTCDPVAELPGELCGLPVTELGGHALSPGHWDDQGEQLEISYGPSPDRDWDNRALEELTIPDTLERVGRYAFYGCRKLKKLRLSDRTLDWGDGALTGCGSLGRFVLDCSGDEGKLLRYLTRETSGELDISLKSGGAEYARLVFPEYLEVYEENCPAHLFDRKVYGAGLSYHNVFTGGKPDFAAYDRLWRDFRGRENEPDCALRLAWFRLRLPEGLTETAREDYSEFIRAHASDAGLWLIGRRDATGLRYLLELAEPDAAVLGRAARDQGFTEGQALLLEARRKRPGKGFDRSFEL